MSEFNADGTPKIPVDETSKVSDVGRQGGRRRRSNGSRKNSWLAHVKATMKVNRSKSFKQVLKLAKKTYKKSKSQSSSSSSSHSQSAGKRRYGKKRGGSSMKQSIDSLLQKQEGGSGMAGKAPFGENAAPVA
jgi:hypothetical protein